MGESVAGSAARDVGVDDDALLLRLFQDEAARLVQMARWFVDDQTAAEDLVQEAFIKLSASLRRLRDPTAPRRTCGRSSSTWRATTTGAASCRCGTGRLPCSEPSAEDDAIDTRSRRVSRRAAGPAPAGSATA